MGLILAAAAGGFVWVFTGPTDTGLETNLPAAVESVQPASGSNVLRQTEIVADLAAGLEGQLSLNGRPAPRDEVRVVSGLNQYAFSPAASEEFDDLNGLVCAVITYWRAGGSFEAPLGSYRWCFTLT